MANLKPNVLLIMVDQMRSDCLSILNHPVVDTPNLDQMARDGVLFTNAYAATPSCVPARASVLTGMSQSSTGRVGYQDKVPWNYKNTIADEFTKAGYHTQSIGKMHVYPTRNLCGFHNVVLHDGYMHYNRFKHNTLSVDAFDSTDDYTNWMRDRLPGNPDLNDLGLDCNSSTVTRPWNLPEYLHPTNWLTTQSIDFLRRRDPTKPFFLKMSYVRPHPPFDPPETFYNMYKDMEMPESPIGDWANHIDDELEGYSPITAKGIVPNQRLNRAKAAYYALITHIDHQIGRFLNAMQEYGVYRDTVILFTSDHGELLGDHHLFRKSLPYEGSAGIPFMVVDPGNYLDIKKNTKSDKVVELRDIMPTLLDAANLPIPDTVEGKSVLPLIRQTADKNLQWREYIHGEHTLGKQSYHSITSETDKYIWYSQTGEEQFFDLSLDPLELNNKISNVDYKQTINARREQLIKSLKEREEGFTDGHKLFVGKSIRAVLKND